MNRGKVTFNSPNPLVSTVTENGSGSRGQTSYDAVRKEMGRSGSMPLDNYYRGQLPAALPGYPGTAISSSSFFSAREYAFQPLNPLLRSTSTTRSVMKIQVVIGCMRKKSLPSHLDSSTILVGSSIFVSHVKPHPGQTFNTRYPDSADATPADPRAINSQNCGAGLWRSANFTLAVTKSQPLNPASRNSLSTDS